MTGPGITTASTERRGFGASSRPSTGYNLATLATDLHVLLSGLDLREVVLAGFAMGTGEITRYLAVHGLRRVSAAVLVAPLLRFLLKTDDNPEGIDGRVSAASRRVWGAGGGLRQASGHLLCGPPKLSLPPGPPWCRRIGP